MKGVKEELHKWRDSPWWWLGRVNIVWISVLPNLLYRVSAFPIKTPGSYFTGIDKLILKCIWRGKWHGTAKSVLKNRAGGLTPPNIKTYSKATGIKTGGTGERTDKVNVTETKNLCSLTENVGENEKTRHSLGENICKRHSSLKKDYYPKYKNLYAKSLKKSNSDLAKTAQVQASKLAQERLEGHL